MEANRRKALRLGVGVSSALVGAGCTGGGTTPVVNVSNTSTGPVSQAPVTSTSPRRASPSPSRRRGPAVINPITGMYHADAYPGVDKTGAADSSTAINAFFAAVPEGGAIYFSEGNYTLRSPLRPPPNDVTIQGAGFGTTITFDPPAGATMLTLAGESHTKFVGLHFVLPATSASTRSTLISLDGAFRCSFTRCTFRGQHETAGDDYGTTDGHVGISISSNAGDNLFYDCDFLNLGVGIKTDSIQNSVNGGKFGTCYVGIWGTSDIGGDGQTNAGMSLSGYVVFVSAAEAGLVSTNILIDGAANQWWLSDCWFEGGGVGISVGHKNGNAGPSMFGMVNCKVAALDVCIDMQSARQPFLANVQFGSSGTGRVTALRVNSDVVDGTAINLIDLIPQDSNQVGGDPFLSLIPAGWTYLGRQHFRAPTQMQGAFYMTSDADTSPSLSVGGHSADHSSDLFRVISPATQEKFIWADNGTTLNVGTGSTYVRTTDQGRLLVNSGGLAGLANETYDAGVLVVPPTRSSVSVALRQHADQDGDALQVIDDADVVRGGILSSGALISDDQPSGIVMKDAAENYWRLTIGTDGSLTSTRLGPSRPTA